MVGISFFSFILHIQFQLDFFLCLCLKVLYLDRVRDRQGFQILYAEAAQKLFRGPEQDRTSRGIQTPQLPDQAVFYQLVDGVITFYPLGSSRFSAFVTGCLYAMMDKVSSITSDSAGF